jgi:hypothetical protein
MPIFLDKLLNDRDIHQYGCRLRAIFGLNSATINCYATTARYTIGALNQNYNREEYPYELATTNITRQPVHR